ncbi:MAG: STAS domain-containing protein [Desulfobacteraceae bacterium]|nr:STAS domain-containing protein [Desulfobacteraceae bacterium]
MTCVTTQENGQIKLTINGSVLIEDAAEFHQQVMHGLETSSHLEVDFKEAGNFDLSAVQILLAAGRYAQKAGINFNIISPSSALPDLLKFLGLDSVIFHEYPGTRVHS